MKDYIGCNIPKLGFGLMRLPQKDGVIDIEQVKQMADHFFANGFTYCDTAYVYGGGASELAAKAAIVERYPRESFQLADKLPVINIEKEEDMEAFVQTSLERTGAGYFDFYLLHALNAKRHELFTEQGIYDIAKALKAEGKIRHLGMSFHDTADVLDQVLTAQPEIEVVQLQLNYVDWEDPNVQSHACYEVCVKHGKPVIVMEPVKGGALVNLPENAEKLMTTGSPASYAIRFAASHDNIMMVLSGMSNMAQMEDNLSYMTDFKPLTAEELETIDQVRTIYQGLHKIPCTACRYCTDGCPAGIPIPDIFACFNEKKRNKEGNTADADYAAFENNASACLGCGQCENECPQHLHIRELLEAVAKAF